MRLKDLFKSYLDIDDTERILFINKLQALRIPPIKIEKLRKKKVELSLEEQALLDKVMGGLNRNI